MKRATSIKFLLGISLLCVCFIYLGFRTSSNKPVYLVNSYIPVDHSEQYQPFITFENKLPISFVPDYASSVYTIVLSVDVGIWHNPKDFPTLLLTTMSSVFGFTSVLNQEIPNLQIQISEDITTISFQTTIKSLSRGLEILADTIINPVFEEEPTKPEYIVEYGSRNVRDTDTFAQYLVYYLSKDYYERMTVHDSLTIPEAAKAHFRYHFHAQNMRLVVSGPPLVSSPIEVFSRFSEIPLNSVDLTNYSSIEKIVRDGAVEADLKNESHEAIPSSPHSRARFLLIEPLRGTFDSSYTVFTIRWILESEFEYAYDRSGSLDFLIYLLCEDNPHSLFHKLVQKNLVRGVRARLERSTRAHSILALSFTISESVIDDVIYSSRLSNSRERKSYMHAATPPTSDLMALKLSEKAVSERLTAVADTIFRVVHSFVDSLDSLIINELMSSLSLQFATMPSSASLDAVKRLGLYTSSGPRHRVEVVYENTFLFSPARPPLYNVDGNSLLSASRPTVNSSTPFYPHFASFNSRGRESELFHWRQTSSSLSTAFSEFLRQESRTQTEIGVVRYAGRARERIVTHDHLSVPTKVSFLETDRNPLSSLSNSPVSVLSRLASRMRYTTMEDLYSPPSSSLVWQPQVLLFFVRQMHPENVVASLSSPLFPLVTTMGLDHTVPGMMGRYFGQLPLKFLRDSLPSSLINGGLSARAEDIQLKMEVRSPGFTDGFELPDLELQREREQQQQEEERFRDTNVSPSCSPSPSATSSPSLSPSASPSPFYFGSTAGVSNQRLQAELGVMGYNPMLAARRQSKSASFNENQSPRPKTSVSALSALREKRRPTSYVSGAGSKGEVEISEEVAHTFESFAEGISAFYDIAASQNPAAVPSTHFLEQKYSFSLQFPLPDSSEDPDFTPFAANSSDSAHLLLPQHADPTQPVSLPIPPLLDLLEFKVPFVTFYAPGILLYQSTHFLSFDYSDDVVTGGVYKKQALLKREGSRSLIANNPEFAKDLGTGKRWYDEVFNSFSDKKNINPLQIDDSSIQEAENILDRFLRATSRSDTSSESRLQPSFDISPTQLMQGSYLPLTCASVSLSSSALFATKSGIALGEALLDAARYRCSPVNGWVKGLHPRADSHFSLSTADSAVEVGACVPPGSIMRVIDSLLRCLLRSARGEVHVAQFYEIPAVSSVVPEKTEKGSVTNPLGSVSFHRSDSMGNYLMLQEDELSETFPSSSIVGASSTIDGRSQNKPTTEEGGKTFAGSAIRPSRIIQNVRGIAMDAFELPYSSKQAQSDARRRFRVRRHDARYEPEFSAATELLSNWADPRFNFYGPLKKGEFVRRKVRDFNTIPQTVSERSAGIAVDTVLSDSSFAFSRYEDYSPFDLPRIGKSRFLFESYNHNQVIMEAVKAIPDDQVTSPAAATEVEEKKINSEVGASKISIVNNMNGQVKDIPGFVDASTIQNVQRPNSMIISKGQAPTRGKENDIQQGNIGGAKIMTLPTVDEIDQRVRAHLLHSPQMSILGLVTRELLLQLKAVQVLVTGDVPLRILAQLSERVGGVVAVHHKKAVEAHARVLPLIEAAFNERELLALRSALISEQHYQQYFANKAVSATPDSPASIIPPLRPSIHLLASLNLVRVISDALGFSYDSFTLPTLLFPLSHKCIEPLGLENLQYTREERFSDVELLLRTQGRRLDSNGPAKCISSVVYQKRMVPRPFIESPVESSTSYYFVAPRDRFLYRDNYFPDNIPSSEKKSRSEKEDEELEASGIGIEVQGNLFRTPIQQEVALYALIQIINGASALPLPLPFTFNSHSSGLERLSHTAMLRPWSDLNSAATETALDSYFSTNRPRMDLSVLLDGWSFVNGPNDVQKNNAGVNGLGIRKRVRGNLKDKFIGLDGLRGLAQVLEEDGSAGNNHILPKASVSVEDKFKRNLAHPETSFTADGYPLNPGSSQRFQQPNEHFPDFHTLAGIRIPPQLTYFPSVPLDLDFPSFSPFLQLKQIHSCKGDWDTIQKSVLFASAELRARDTSKDPKVIREQEKEVDKNKELFGTDVEEIGIDSMLFCNFELVLVAHVRSESELAETMDAALHRYISIEMPNRLGRTSNLPQRLETLKRATLAHVRTFRNGPIFHKIQAAEIQGFTYNFRRIEAYIQALESLTVDNLKAAASILSNLETQGRLTIESRWARRGEPSASPGSTVLRRPYGDHIIVNDTAAS